MSVGKNLRIKRKEMKFSTTSLAKAIGVGQSTIVRYENGDVHRIPEEQLEKISKVLGCSVDELTAGDPKYGPVKKKRVSSKMFTEEEQNLILQYRQLPLQARNTIKEICGWHISISD